MMDMLEHVSDRGYMGYFVDLYVRCTNTVAIGMYENMGYSVYRRVSEYYGSLGKGRESKDEEDAFGAHRFFVVRSVADHRTQRGTYDHALPTDMRKPLSRDSNRRSVRHDGRQLVVSAHDVP